MLSTQRTLTSFSEETFINNTETNKFELKKSIVFKNEEKKLNK